MEHLMPIIWKDHVRLCALCAGHAFAARAPEIDEYIWRGLYTYPILVYRNWILHMTNEEKLGLPPAFPVVFSKSLVSNFGFQCSYDGRYMFLSFHAAYAAKHFLNTLLHGITYKWVAANKIEADNGLTIKGETDECLERAMEHTFTANELRWRAPEPYPYYWASFLGKRSLPDLDYSMPKHLHPTGRGSSPTTKQRKKLSDEERRAKAVAKVRTGDHVTIAKIAEDLKSEPRVLRALLRKLAIEKPEHGWAWPPSEAARITSKLRGMLRGPRDA